MVGRREGGSPAWMYRDAERSVRSIESERLGRGPTCYSSPAAGLVWCVLVQMLCQIGDVGICEALGWGLGLEMGKGVTVQQRQWGNVICRGYAVNSGCISDFVVQMQSLSIAVSTVPVVRW